MNDHSTDDSVRWQDETATRPGTPKAKSRPDNGDRYVAGPGVYSEVFEDFGPLVIRTSKY